MRACCLYDGRVRWSPKADGKALLRSLVRGLGFDLVRLSPSVHGVARRLRLMSTAGIDVVFDVGANIGQYAAELRRFGYSGRIVSVEPLAHPFRELSRTAAGDPRWEVVNAALGERRGRATMNVAANVASSSLLAMLPAHEQAAPQARMIGQEEVETRTLADLMLEHSRDAHRLMVKLDVQGYEGRLLASAPSDSSIVAWQLEMSLVPLYAGEQTMVDLVATLLGRGYELVNVEPGFADPVTGRLLQMDGLFIRHGLLPALGSPVTS